MVSPAPEATVHLSDVELRNQMEGSRKTAKSIKKTLTARSECNKKDYIQRAHITAWGELAVRVSIQKT